MSLMITVQIAAAVNVKIDGVDFSDAKLVDSVTYVPIRAFSNEFVTPSVSWNSKTRTATVTSDNLHVSARAGEKYINGNERIIYSGNRNLVLDGTMYVPVRSIAKTMGASVSWDSKTRTAHVASDTENFRSADEFYNWNDLYWLAKIINAESEGESLEGKIAVGNVVMNRVSSTEFPNNIYDVIFDRKGGVQFTPVANGSINKYPRSDSFLAAKICLENYKLSDKEILFFLNPAISTSSWVPNNRDFVMSIGNHDFYA